MQRYIALDVHQASSTLAVLSESGKQLKSCRVEAPRQFALLRELARTHTMIARDVVRGRVQQTRGLTRQHNHTLKEIFKGAATTVVTQPNTYAVYAAYEHMTNSGTKPNLAKVTLARMIAAIVLRMWKDEECYQPRHTTESKQSASQA